MNALEQEYAENVKRAARREKIRIVALGAAALTAGSVGAALAGHAAWILPGLLLAAWSIGYWYIRLAPRIVPEPANDELVEVEHGYRDVRSSIQQTNKRALSPLFRFAIATLTAVVIWVLFVWFHEGAWTRTDGDFVVRVGALIVTCIGVLVKFAYDAWKKRHDAKLMVEWERRLEEMK